MRLEDIIKEFNLQKTQSSMESNDTSTSKNAHVLRQSVGPPAVQGPGGVSRRAWGSMPSWTCRKLGIFMHKESSRFKIRIQAQVKTKLHDKMQ